MREMNVGRIVICMVDGTVFRGQVNIGAARRLSDFFRRGENPFLVLFEASIGNSPEKDVFFLNRDHILWVKPDPETSCEQCREIMHMETDAPLL